MKMWFVGKQGDFSCCFLWGRDESSALTCSVQAASPGCSCICGGTFLEQTEDAGRNSRVADPKKGSGWESLVFQTIVPQSVDILLWTTYSGRHLFCCCMLGKYCCLYYRFNCKSSEPSRLVFWLGFVMLWRTGNVWICKQSRKITEKHAYCMFRDLVVHVSCSRSLSWFALVFVGM